MSEVTKKRQRTEDEVLLALANTPTVAEAARALEVSERTIFRYLATPEFAERWRQLRAERLNLALRALQDGAGEAVACLRRNLVCGVPSAEIRAAGAILEYGLRASELLDLQARVEALEALREVRYAGRSA